MDYMFANSGFEGDISQWNVSNVTSMCGMFDDSSLEWCYAIPEWYKTVSTEKKKEEKIAFDVILAECGNSFMKVFRLVRDITGLGLAETQKITKTANSIIKKSIPKAYAEFLKKKLEELGAKVTLKEVPTESLDNSKEKGVLKPFSARKNWMDDLREDSTTGKEETSNSSSRENNDCSQVKSPWSGRISRIVVKAGDSVIPNQEVAFVESLMMEWPVVCCSEGIVKEILVKESDTVSDDQVIMIIE